MNARTKRSWWHMIELGSTMTLEAWDADFKKNLTWNHAWGSAPANILARFVLGVRPLAPGYAEMLIAPQLGTLKWVRGQVPTALGPVTVNATTMTCSRLSRMSRETPKRASISRAALPAKSCWTKNQLQQRMHPLLSSTQDFQGDRVSAPRWPKHYLLNHASAYHLSDRLAVCWCSCQHRFDCVRSLPYSA